jgi:ParB-like chromosome segregation protein Spo0J
MEIIEMDISEIKPYKDNPREISQEAVKKVKNSISEFGNNQPIVIDQNNVIVVGHTRWKALKQLNKTKAYVIKKNFDKNKAVAYRIMDNRSGAESKWDKQLLMSELQVLKDNKFDLDLTGFDALELKDIILDKDLFEPTDKDDQGKLDQDTKEICPECGQVING